MHFLQECWISGRNGTEVIEHIETENGNYAQRVYDMNPDNFVFGL